MTGASAARIVQSRLAIFGIVFVVHAAVVFLVIGAPRMGVDSGWYADAADHLIAAGFDYREFSQRVSSVPPPIFYLQFVLVTALCKLALGASWALGVVVVNLVAESLVAVQLVRLVHDLTRDVAAAVFALALYLVASDVVLWSAYVLSDSIFLLLSFSLFSWTVRMFWAERAAPGWRAWAILGSLFVLTVTQRPLGFVVLPAIGLAIWSRSRFGRLPPPWPAVSLAGLVLLAIVPAVGFLVVLRNEALWAGLGSMMPLRHFAEMYREGTVVYSRPETAVSAPHSLTGYIFVAVVKFWYFFAFSAAGFSRSHAILKSVFFVPAYAFAVAALYALARGGAGVDPGRRWVPAVAAAFIVCFAVFHALTEVDFDWRYRVPVIPHLVLLAAIGLSVTVRRGSHAR